MQKFCRFGLGELSLFKVLSDFNHQLSTEFQCRHFRQVKSKIKKYITEDGVLWVSFMGFFVHGKFHLCGQYQHFQSAD